MTRAMRRRRTMHWWRVFDENFGGCLHAGPEDARKSERFDHAWDAIRRIGDDADRLRLGAIRIG